MVFNIQKFLVENKLTKRSRLNEDDTTGGMLKTDAEQEEMSDEEDGVFGDEEAEDAWYKGDEDDSSEFEKEPAKADVKEPATVSGIQKKELELKTLEDKKDALLLQLKSGQLSLDQYKAAIGNIPSQIKKLRADIDQAMTADLGDDEDLA